ncbi:MAG: N-formylglutamate amidohydrolase [Alphaproteobacteria bacterium]|nr:N-formylglutamate amidohydrolase [Alphaproteobacteria bacterium]
MICDQPFFVHNGESPVYPVIISVPHAGRHYPQTIQQALRVPLYAVRALEDRYADALAQLCIAAGFPTIIAQVPRLMIDLNRAPDDHEYTHASHVTVQSHARPLNLRAMQGLGVVPTRLGHVGALWRDRPTLAVIQGLVKGYHTPYHEMLHTLLWRTRRKFGCAILLDLHSMPSLGHGPQLVFGDRQGESAGALIRRRALEAVSGSGFRVGLNTPYAGGYTLARHGQPAYNIHAVQIEVDRALYLDAQGAKPSSALPGLQELIHGVACALSDCAARFEWLSAAE